MVLLFLVGVVGEEDSRGHSSLRRTLRQRAGRDALAQAAADFISR